MKKILAILVSFLSLGSARAQEAFTITHYNVTVKVNQDASMDIREDIRVHFTEPRHGIIRKIPFKYRIIPQAGSPPKAELQMLSGGYRWTIIDQIAVPGWSYELSQDGDYKSIRIGSSGKYVHGDQVYVIHYRVLNAINFFKDHSEFYYNVIGDQWNTTIDSVNFKVELYEALPQVPFFFVATGSHGSRVNNTVSEWKDNQIFSGRTTTPLLANQGVTIGIRLPQGYLKKPDYRFYGFYWILLPFFVLGTMYYIWRRWGKDDSITVQTEYYPPDHVSPSICGYIMDDKLNRRDLTALVPYWGAGGYLKINEIEKSAFLGLLKEKEFEFVKLKELPASAYNFEKTLFDGIFKSGDTVKLSALKNVLYITMNQAKRELEREIDMDDYYVKYSRGFRVLLSIAGIFVFGFGVIQTVGNWEQNRWFGISLMASGLIVFLFGIFMAKKTKKGTELLRKLAGFKEFIKSVEQDKLKEFLKEDPQYFDKVLPYAIVFNVADQWKDRLKGLDIPPPSWYNGVYPGNTFNTMVFMDHLDRSMNQMSSAFYSAPQGSAGGGGSFGGGGFSGGGFGGGGGSSW
ncbi:MAG: DUF2207 domain-containing protein [Bacteroidota bacterium]|nr:DUF2207 domain-containing protein [Bacteroidota bacterium]